MQQKSSSWCGKYSVIGPVKGNSGRIGYKRLRCKSLRCGRCRFPKLHETRNRIAQIASERRLTKFVSLTLDPERIPSGMRSEVYLRDCWRKMRVYLSRRFGKSIDFIAVLEFQQSGVAHLHLLVGVFIPQRWLSEAWQSVGGGEIVDIRFVDIHRVAGYLTRYLSGDKIADTLSCLPSRGRIFGSSRSISFWGKKEKRGWWMVKASLDTLREHAANIDGERFEAIDFVTCVFEQLVYFEAWLISHPIVSVDAFDALGLLARSA